MLEKLNFVVGKIVVMNNLTKKNKQKETKTNTSHFKEVGESGG
jgi:hypothetical protein